MNSLGRLCVAAVCVAFCVFSAAASNVKELTDANFEQETQSVTGNTSGDWFIKFYAPWCGHCKSMAKAWEDLAEELVQVVNVADVDATVHSQTAKRFKIRGFPTVVFLSKGLLYEYKGERSTDKLKAFALGGFKETDGKPIPDVMTAFDVVKDELLSAFRNLQGFVFHAPLPFFMLLGFGVLIGALLTLLLLCACRRKEVVKPSVSKKKD